MSAIDPDLLERLRQSGLLLDRDGYWWHEGQQVQHGRLAQALHRWLDRLDDGRYIVRLDAQRYSYVEVEDVPYIVRSLGERQGQYLALLSDGSHEALDPATLWLGDNNALYCRVKSGRFDARLSRAAHFALGEQMEQDEGGYVLVASGQRYFIKEAAKSV